MISGDREDDPGLKMSDKPLPQARGEVTVSFYNISIVEKRVLQNFLI